MDEIDVALICKALGDPNRLKIVTLLADGEKCGFSLLDELNITQPTLSHHMKILTEAGIVVTRKECTRMCYHLNCEVLCGFKDFIAKLECSRKAEFSADSADETE